MSAPRRSPSSSPAYNEAENIVGTLTNVTAALAPLPIDAEILVIDDGSTDDTAALVQRARRGFRACSCS